MKSLERLDGGQNVQAVRRSSLGLAGPALVHLRHQQEAERLGESNVATVRQNIGLLKEYLQVARDQDLEDFLQEWETAESNNVEAEGALMYPLYPIAESLVGYIELAQVWKKSVLQQPN